jgi:glycosyltransferase 2 family protein
MKRLLLTTLRYVVPLALIAWLVVEALRSDPQKLADLADRPKDWSLLAGAGGLCLAAVALTFVRWRALMLALDIPFSLGEAFRLGFLGYALNLVAPGSVGGDLFKAYYVARQMPRRRAEAIATVVLDRVIGLYVLVLLAACVFAVSPAVAQPELKAVAATVYATTVAGAVGLGLMLFGGVSARLSARVASLPKIGPTIGQLMAALALYRSRPATLVTAGVLSLIVQSMFAVGLYMFAAGLLPAATTPTLGEHFLMVPLAMLTGVVPVPGGLGAFEGALEFLYRWVPATAAQTGDGLLVALAYRLMTLVITGIGLVFYMVSRKQVSAVLASEPVAHGVNAPAL